MWALDILWVGLLTEIMKWLTGRCYTWDGYTEHRDRFLAGMQWKGEVVDFTVLLRKVCNIKLMNGFQLEFSTEYFWNHRQKPHRWRGTTVLLNWTLCAKRTCLYIGAHSSPSSLLVAESGSSGRLVEKHWHMHSVISFPLPHLASGGLFVW